MTDILLGLGAIVFGVALSYGLFWFLNLLFSLLPKKILSRVQWLAFLTPALVLVTLVLVLPIFQTVIWSFMDDRVTEFVGWENYINLFTDPDFLGVLLNNFLWVLIVPAITVAIGTLVATLSNQVGPTREKIFKSLIKDGNKYKSKEIVSDVIFEKLSSKKILLNINKNTKAHTSSKNINE